MKMIMCGMVTALIAFSTGTARAQACAPAGDTKSVPDIALAELKQAVADKSVTLIDCNGSAAYAAGHIPGAINFATSKEDLAAKLPENKAALVVAYCGGPACGAYKAGAAAAAKLGYTNVKHFSGGTKGWKEAGESFATASLCKQCGSINGTKPCCKQSKP